MYQTQVICSGCEGKKFVIPDSEKCEGCQGNKVVKDSSKIVTVVREYI